MERIPILIPSIPQVWGIPVLEIEEIMIFKKWYMNWKSTFGSIADQITQAFIDGTWEE